MKTIIEYYGAALISMVVIMSILTILMVIPDGKGNVGIFEIMGAGAGLDTGLYENMTDTDTVVMENTAIPAPTLSYSDEWTPFKAGTAGSLAIFNFEMKTSRGTFKGQLTSNPSVNGINVLAYEIRSITDESGESCMNYYDAARKSFKFEKPGIYKIEIFCENLIDGKNTVVTFSVPVGEV